MRGRAGREERLPGRSCGSRPHQYFPKLCPPSAAWRSTCAGCARAPGSGASPSPRWSRSTVAPGTTTSRSGQHPRYVNEKCTLCGACVDVCPVERADAFNLGMGTHQGRLPPPRGGLPHALRDRRRRRARAPSAAAASRPAPTTPSTWTWSPRPSRSRPRRSSWRRAGIPTTPRRSRGWASAPIPTSSPTS